MYAPIVVSHMLHIFETPDFAIVLLFFCVRYQPCVFVVREELVLSLSILPISRLILDLFF